MSSITNRVLTVAVLLAAGAGPAAAQEAPTLGMLVPGARVRLEWVAERAGPRRGSVGEPAPDSAGFVLRPSNRGRPLRVQFAELTNLEVRTHRSSHTGEGMLLGLIAGVAGAFLLTPHQGYDVDPRLFVAVPAGLVGVLVGAAVASSRATETWTAIPIR